MPLPIAALLAGAGALSSLMKSQQYYREAEAPSRAQIYGDAVGSGIGGYIGGAQLGGGDPLGILGSLGGMGIGQQAAGGGPRVLNPAGQAAIGQGGGGGGLLSLLANSGLGGGGLTGGSAAPNILALSQFTQPRNQSGLNFGSLV